VRWLFFLPIFLLADHMVTYNFSGGRFGDNLIAYLHAKWIAQQYHLVFLYRPFKYSDELVMDEEEIPLQGISKPRKKVYLDQGPKEREVYHPTLYVCPYFPEDPSEWMGNEQNRWFSFHVDWKDRAFREEVRKMIRPKRELPLISPPPDQIGVAIHVREGGGFDLGVNIQTGDPTKPYKFPPLQFYVEALKQVLERLPGRRIYCYVFTDAKDPKGLIDQIKAQVTGEITWDWRKEGNRHDKDVLIDFFSFFNFDVLIRSRSNFSMVASLIHDFAIVCSPKEIVVMNGKVVPVSYDLEINEELLREL
jgi:hypothetical protein